MKAELLACSGCGLMVRRVADDVGSLYKSGWQSPLENLNLPGGTTPPLGHIYVREAVESLEEVEEAEHFDGTVAIDVTERLTPPWKQLQMVRRLFVANAWLYLSKPNGWGLNARINKKNWREAHNPSHMLLFTPPSVERVLQKAGFTRCQRLRWWVNYSENKLIQAKDWLLRSVWLDGVLHYLAYA